LNNEELERKSLVAALEYVNSRFNLQFADNFSKNISDNQLVVLLNMMEDFVEPEDRDIFYDTIEQYQDGYINGYKHAIAKEEDNK